MDRGAWRAAVCGVAESDTADETEHTRATESVRPGSLFLMSEGAPHHRRQVMPASLPSARSFQWVKLESPLLLMLLLSNFPSADLHLGYKFPLSRLFYLGLNLICLLHGKTPSERFPAFSLLVIVDSGRFRGSLSTLTQKPAHQSPGCKTLTSSFDGKKFDGKFFPARLTTFNFCLRGLLGVSGVSTRSNDPLE